MVKQTTEVVDNIFYFGVKDWKWRNMFCEAIYTLALRNV